MSLEIDTLKQLLHDEVDQLEDMAVRRRLQYLLVCSTPERREQLAASFVKVVSNYLKENELDDAQILGEVDQDRVTGHLKELEEDGMTLQAALMSHRTRNVASLCVM